MKKERELRIILSALSANNIHPTLYKGAALAHTVYPTPACRPMGDLDLWINHHDISMAQTVIEKLGYKQAFKDARPIALHQQYDGEVELIGQHPHQGVVELHWGVFAGQWLQRVSSIDRKGVFQRRVQAEIVGNSVYLLSNEDAVIQLAVHLGINHQLSLHPLRSLIDILLLDQQGVDWALVVERAYAWRLATVVGAVLNLLLAIFGIPSVTSDLMEAAIALRHSPMRRGIITRWVNTNVVLHQTKISVGRARFLYLLSMVDRPSDALYLLMRTVWPESEWLKMRYGQVNWPIRLQHIASSIQGNI